MQNTEHEILLWLPSPLGDAILCTPALRAVRRRFASAKISFLADAVVRDALSPCPFNDAWLSPAGKNPVAIAGRLRKHRFTHAILLKNSFGSALAVFLARIPERIGYARQGRYPFLTERLYPPKLPGGRFKPGSMVDYYLAIASRLGADTTDRTLELAVEPGHDRTLAGTLPEVLETPGPLVILVPGGAFGRSKCWPSERFSRTADWLIDNYKATVVISVAPNALERKIAAQISASSTHVLISLADKPLDLDELKSLFARADLVITNDTGPRHIAIALRRKVVTLFGPNDPAWTDTGYQNEIQIVGNVPCAPCARPRCRRPDHICMRSITVEMVCRAAAELLENDRTKAVIKVGRELVETSESFFVDPDHQAALRESGLTSLDSVFSFNAGRDLTKSNLARFRDRVQFDAGTPPTTFFLKRYDRPPFRLQVKSWLAHGRRKSCASFEVEAAAELAATGINTPKVICRGRQWGRLFERRSFLITERIPDAESLEMRLPDCFDGPPTVAKLRARREFISHLAAFVRRFHDTGFRHRDLYLCHIFHSPTGQFCLIDLARAFRPRLRQKRFAIKDIAQLHYSAPATDFSRTDRLRFYIGYAGRTKLTQDDKRFIRRVTARAATMARRDAKHGRTAPFQR